MVTSYNSEKDCVLINGGQVGTIDLKKIPVNRYEVGNILRKGDIFTIPTKEKMKENTFMQIWQGREVYGIFVTKKDGSLIKLFFNTLTRSVTPCNEDCSDIPNAKEVFSSGTIVEIYLKFKDAEESLNAIAGKTCIVSGVQPVRCRRIRTRNGNMEQYAGNQHVYQIDEVIQNL
jgi:hypothetical protein